MDNDYNRNSALAIVWAALHTYAENELGNKIGHGYCNKEDDLYEEHWNSICEAMAILKEGQ